MGRSGCDCCHFMSWCPLPWYNLQELWLMSSEFVLCHWSVFLKHTWKCVMWLLQLWLMLIFGIFLFHSAFSIDSWSLRLEGANWSSYSAAEIWESINVALKHFLQHSYNFLYILCTYYPSSRANAGFAVRKLCDCGRETEVIIKLRTSALFHRMISVSILMTFLEGEEHRKVVSNSLLLYTQQCCSNLCSTNLRLGCS